MPLIAKLTSLFLFFMLISIEVTASELKKYNIDIGPINGVSAQSLLFSFRERTYGNGESVSTLIEKNETLLPEEEFLIKRNRAVLRGNVGDYTKLWHPIERNKIKSFYKKNNDAWTGLMTLKNDLSEEKLISIYYYKEYILICTISIPKNGEPYMGALSTLVNDRGRLYLTNRLSGDGESNYISSVLSVNLLKTLGYLGK